MSNPEKWYRWTYLQGRNRAQTEGADVWTHICVESGMSWEAGIDRWADLAWNSPWEAVVQHGELSSMLRDDLRVGQGGREFDEERDICIQ